MLVDGEVETGELGLVAVVTGDEDRACGFCREVREFPRPCRIGCSGRKVLVGRCHEVLWLRWVGLRQM
jgi:hypothetical protein